MKTNVETEKKVIPAKGWALLVKNKRKQTLHPVFIWNASVEAIDLTNNTNKGKLQKLPPFFSFDSISDDWINKVLKRTLHIVREALNPPMWLD